MNVGQITDRNLNARQLRNRLIPFTPPQVTSLIRNLDSSIPWWSSFSWSSPPQKLKLWSQNHYSAERLRPALVIKSNKGIRKMNKLHPLPQSVRVLRYKLDSRIHYQKGTPWPSLSKLLEGNKETQDSQCLKERYPSVNPHDIPPAPQAKIVNDSNA